MADSEIMKILVGDCRETLKTIPDGTVHTCVTYALRHVPDRDTAPRHPRRNVRAWLLPEVLRAVGAPRGESEDQAGETEPIHEADRRRGDGQ